MSTIITSRWRQSCSTSCRCVPRLVVAEIGCGSGGLTLPLTAQLPRGLVHAIDSAPTMLTVVRERARAAGHTNIATHLVAQGRYRSDRADLTVYS